METTLQTDVLIVGAGPVGLALAAQLARYNIGFVIVDQKEGCSELSKALIVQARTLEIYEQLELAQRAVADGQIVQKAVVMQGGHASASIDFLSLGGQSSPFPFALIFEQSKNEHLLYEYLQNSGKEVRWRSELQSLQQDKDGVSATLLGPNGELQNIRAKYLIGCDGASSPTRHFLGLDFQGSTAPRLFYVADVEMEFEASADSLYMTFGRDAFVLLIPMKGEKHWRLLGNLPEYDDGNEKEIVYAEIEAKVKQLVQQPLDITGVSWFSTYKVHSRHVGQFSLGRCFLAGDAAHIHTPVGGQGMNTGIQDAYNLAWKLAAVLNQQAGPELLASYNEERLRNARELVQTTDQVFEGATGDAWYLQFFREHLLPGLLGFVTHFDATKKSIFARISETGIHYRASSLSWHQSKTDRGDHDFAVKAGDRMPYFLVDGTSVYQKIKAPQFHLLVFSPQKNEFGALAPKLAATYGNKVSFQEFVLDDQIETIFGVSQPFLLLLRPDHYLAFISTTMTLDSLEAYFSLHLHV